MGWTGLTEITISSGSHTESKNMCIMSVCTDFTELGGAKSGKQVLMALKYLNWLQELCVTATAAAPTAGC